MQKKKCNEDYFRLIDTEDKAYWLGFLYADGCVDKNGRNTIVSLSPIDYEYLRCFNECIESDYEIKKRDSGRYITLNICKSRFCNNLIKNGCVPAKSLILTFPSNDIVPEYLIRHFIRGYFDGDGCISTILRNKKGKPNPVMECEVNFLGTLNFLNGVVKNIPLDNIKIFKFGNIYKFRIRNKKDIITLLDYLYEDSHFYLKRKHDKYIDNVKNYITKRHPLNKNNI